MLRNGDRVSGQFTGKAGDTLVVRTLNAGEVFVDWKAIARINTDGPVELMLKGAGSPLVGRLETDGQGRATLVGQQGERTAITLDEVDYLDPAVRVGAAPIYSGHVRLAAVYARGDANNDQLYAEAQQNARAEQYRYQVDGKIDRRTALPASIRTSWRLSGIYDRFISKPRFAYLQGWLEHDDARHIDRLAVLGAGLGTLLQDTPRAQLSARAGLYHLTLQRDFTPARNVPAFGWGVEARYAPWGPRVQLFHQHLGLTSLHGDGTFVRSKTGVRSPLPGRFYAVAQLNLNWDSKTAPGGHSTDTVLLLGLDYGW